MLNMILLLIVFDFNVIIFPETFKQLVKDQMLKDQIVPIFVTFVIIAFFIWAVTVIVVEKSTGSFSYSKRE